MRVCSTVAEYNPLHAGHLKHIEYMKNTLGAEKIIVIMSGDFTQRGEPAVLNKFTRAKHAVIAGADIVIELPTVFAVLAEPSASKSPHRSAARSALNQGRKAKKPHAIQSASGVGSARGKARSRSAS